MARRVKNASTWLEAQRNLRKQWSKEILKRSPRSAEELNVLERDYSAQTLFAHPERFEDSQSQIKEYIDELRDIRKAVLREEMRSRGGPREAEWKPGEKKKKKKRKKPSKFRTIEAKAGFDPSTGEKLYIIDSVKELGDNIAGVTFDVHKVETDKGIRHRFNVTKRGRNIEQRKGAPPLYDHPDEKKLFKTEQDAYLRARRVIHAALIWYEERRGAERKIKEKRRVAGAYKKHIEAIRARVVPRVGMHKVKPGTYEAEVLGHEVGSYIKEEVRGGEKLRRAWEVKQRRKGRRPSKGAVTAWETEVTVKEKGGKVSKHKVPGSARTTKKPRKLTSKRIRRAVVEAEIRRGKFRTPKRMLKGNPSEPVRAAKSAIARYNSEFSTWQRSMQTGRPKFGALMRAYDALENARANYSLADREREAKAVNTRIIELRDAIVSLMEAQESEEIIEAAYEVNPPKAVHQKNGAQFLSKSEKAWNRYCEKLQTKDLLDAYENLVLAEQELGYANDKEGLKQTRAGLKSARAELASHLKRKTAKKKAAKKK